MNAWTPSRSARKAAMAEFEKETKAHAEHVAQSVLALMAYIMYSKWHCGAETCRKRVRAIADMLNAPQVFGQDIHDTDYINWCRDTLNLDVEEEVKLKVKVDFV